MTARGLRALSDPLVMGAALRPTSQMTPAPNIILGVLQGCARVAFDVCEMISWAENELCEQSGRLMAEAATHAVKPSAQVTAAASAAIAACLRKGHVKAGSSSATPSGTSGQKAGPVGEDRQGSSHEGDPGLTLPTLQQLQAALDSARAWLQLVLPFVATLAVLPLGDTCHPTWSSGVCRRVVGCAAAASPLTLHYIVHHAGEDGQRTYIDAIHYCCPGACTLDVTIEAELHVHVLLVGHVAQGVVTSSPWASAHHQELLTCHKGMF